MENDSTDRTTTETPIAKNSLVRFAIVTILFTIIGSYLWETLLRQSAGTLNAQVILIVGWISSQVVDQAYLRATYDSDLFYTGAMFCCVLCVLPGIVLLFNFLFLTYIVNYLIHSRKTSLKNRIKSLRSSRIVSFLFMTFNSIIIIGSFLYCVVNVSLVDLAYRSRVDFERRFDVLAPRLTEQERLQFKADWAFVDNKASYDGLMNRLANEARSKKLSVPRPVPG
jgi:hypothetical protein